MIENIQHSHAGKDQRDKWIDIVRYADDFVLLINMRLYTDEPKITQYRVEVCKRQTMKKVRKVLSEMGLKINEEKTRWIETNKGFDFLGFNVRQYKVCAYRSAQSTNGTRLGYKTLIKPSKKSVLKHYHKLAEIIRTQQNAPKEALITKLNPIIRGWCNYYSIVVSQKIFSKLDCLVFKRIMRMLHRKHKCGTQEIVRKCFDKIGNRNWAYGNLLEHAKNPIIRHVKIRGDQSPFDGDWKYWANRSQKYSGLTNRQQFLFKKQKGKCNWCNSQFSVEDLNRMEIDHIKPKALGGTNDWKNLQLLHRHCHDSKTAEDLKLIRQSKKQASWDNNPW